MAKRKKTEGKKGKKGKKTQEKKAQGKKELKQTKQTQRPAQKRKAREEKKPAKTAEISGWKPKTELGRKTKDREITNVDEILDKSLKILEPEIVDSLLELEQDLLLIGQSKGKFGGGSRRVFRQTQKKTREGNKPRFSTMAVVGDKNGHIGIGFGKAKETVPAREKAIRKAKLNLFKIRRGCGSWQCGCKTPHSIPFAVKGKCGSVQIELMPAPKGKGLCSEKEIAKILELAGVKDVWAKTRGQTKNKINFIYACEDALRKLVKTKVQPEHYEAFAIAEGSLAEEQEKEQEQKPEQGAEEQAREKKAKGEA
ncbi:30S ribosomal protein S5 [Candidatus Woesearchaeota archaeon]|nr:30S ribosomal protein S5 [Candidatus Woesearchaeota archaeon]